MTVQVFNYFLESFAFYDVVEYRIDNRLLTELQNRMSFNKQDEGVIPVSSALLNRTDHYFWDNPLP